MRILFLVPALFFCMMVSGQGLGDFKSRLRSAGLSSGGAVIVEHGGAAAAVRDMSSATRPDKIRGYRVRIFFDNAQNARGASREVANRFRELYPDIAVSPEYSAPYYKVTVGNCVSLEEATILWGKVKGSFEKAFIVREDIPLSALAVYVPPSKADETTVADE